MTLVLAGDIGGTKTLLRLVETGSSGELLQNIYEANYPSRDYPDLVPIVQKFLATAKEQLGHQLIPEKACFGVAGPVVDNTSNLTILGWSLEAHRLEQELGIAAVSLINDFAAVGYGILGLQKSDIHTLQVGKPNQNAPIAVMGAGTGLGEGFLIKQGNTYQVFGSEGGHTDFPPRNELEFRLLRYLIDKHNIQHVSVERVVSGQGIVSIYQFLRDRHIAPESPDIAEAIREWESEAGQSKKTVEPAAVISKAALAGSDRLCEQTMQMFIEAYGAEAGNFALKLLPYGGMYIAGGIASKILPLLQKGSFLDAFNQKGRLSSMIRNIPLYVIRNEQVGLIGAAVCAARS